MNSHSSGNYVCKVPTVAIGTKSPKILDRGTFTAGTTWGEYPCRVKVDAQDLFDQFDASPSVYLADPADADLGELRAAAGLPKAQPAQGYTYLAGGTKASTTEAAVEAAIDALEAVDGNFLVPLFSRDAADDISDALTESGSTYAVDTLNVYAQKHCSKQSTLKERRNRQAIVSKRGTFLAAKTAAQNIAYFRVAMAFQDVKDIGLAGLTQFQPWMASVKAAAMQAAGSYRAIFNKKVACSGALQAAKDFNPKKTTPMEEALSAGLLPMKTVNGTTTFVSDQTTYSKDDNFVFNSIQAVYASDTVAVNSGRRMEAALVGKSVADIDASLAKAIFEKIQEDHRDLKLIAKSDDAPLGFKNLRIQQKGPSLFIRCEIKLAGAIYFVPISFLATPVQTSASG